MGQGGSRKKRFLIRQASKVRLSQELLRARSAGNNRVRVRAEFPWVREEFKKYHRARVYARARAYTHAYVEDEISSLVYGENPLNLRLKNCDTMKK